MTVISDSSPLISLSAAQKLSILRDLFKEIFIPDAVFAEVVARGEKKLGADDVASAGWIVRHVVADQDAVQTLRHKHHLGSGEAEVIVLAERLSADWIIIDERRARKTAASKGLKVIGTLGITVIAKELGLIDSVRDVLHAMMQSGFRVSRATYHATLLRAREIEK